MEEMHRFVSLSATGRFKFSEFARPFTYAENLRQTARKFWRRNGKAGDAGFQTDDEGNAICAAKKR